MLTQRRLKQLLCYDPTTGYFVWKSPQSNRVKVGQRAGCKTRSGYRSICVDGVKYRAGQLAILFVTGEFPALVDHADGDKSRDAIINLRAANKSLNAANSKRQKNNTSGYKGVSWHRGAWHAYINVRGKRHRLGRFNTAGAAHAAYVTAAQKYFGEFARAA